MGRPKKNYTNRELEEGRTFWCEIYQKSDDYDSQIILNRLSSFWDNYFYILHDKDCWHEIDIEKWKIEHPDIECPHYVGEPKKSHYHIIGNMEKSPLILGTASTKFGVKSQFVQRCTLEKAIKYLIHTNEPWKFQYDSSEIVTNNDVKLKRFLKKEMDATDKAKSLIDFINSCDCISLNSLAVYACNNNLWDELRRGQHIYTSLFFERNNKK